MLRLSADAWATMVGDCYDGLPLEACGLLGGHVATGRVLVCHPLRNASVSARVYSFAPREQQRADDAIGDAGLEVVGVYHSHTHTDAYPSPTDIAAAVPWVRSYVLVSLRDGAPVTRSYRIVDGTVAEESVVLER